MCRRQLAEPPLQKLTLDLILAERESAAVAGCGFVKPSSPAQKVGARRMVEVIVFERLAETLPVQYRQSLFGAIRHRDCYGLVQLNNR